MSGLKRTQYVTPTVPATPGVDPYSLRIAKAESVYNAEPSVPATQYATVRSGLSVHGFAPPTIAPKVRAFFKDNHWRLNGIRNYWSWGSVNMGNHTVSLPGSGTGLVPSVRSTDFQKHLVALHDWSQNDKWYICWNGSGSGMFQGSKEVRYQYPSFRVSQVRTRTSGGPGPVGMQMTPRARYTAVQRIKKYTATPRYYDTHSNNQSNTGGGRSSNVNGPGNR